MQAPILCFRWLEILGLVGNFELKTFPKDGELWIEILPQGAGSLTPNFCFWSKSHPIILSPLGHNIVSAFQNGRILREDSSSKWRSWSRSSGDAVKICFFLLWSSDYLAVFLSLKAAVLMDGIHTEVFCSCYQDRIFVIVSQFEKMGNLVSFRRLEKFFIYISMS